MYDGISTEHFRIAGTQIISVKETVKLYTQKSCVLKDPGDLGFIIRIMGYGNIADTGG
jgi:hypothetical protein